MLSFSAVVNFMAMKGRFRIRNSYIRQSALREAEVDWTVRFCESVPRYLNSTSGMCGLAERDFLKLNIHHNTLYFWPQNYTVGMYQRY